MSRSQKALSSVLTFGVTVRSVRRYLLPGVSVALESPTFDGIFALVGELLYTVVTTVPRGLRS